MKKMCGILVFIIMLTSSCDYVLVNSHSMNTSYINPRKAIDSKAFSACIEDHILGSYFARKPTAYNPGKDSLRSFFFQNFDSQGFNNESGYITVRFIVNCKGQAGRYILDQVGLDYQEKRFPSDLTDTLLVLTQQLQDWRPMQSWDNVYDSYHHLTFKINNGELEEILP